MVSFLWLKSQNSGLGKYHDLVQTPTPPIGDVAPQKQSIRKRLASGPSRRVDRFGNHGTLALSGLPIFMVSHLLELVS